MNHLWLEQEIAYQLDLARVWLTRTDGTTDEEWANLRLYEDSGSCVRISVRVPEDRRDNCLRIVKARTSDPLLLTDGAVSIEASLSSECRRSLRTRHPDRSFAVRKYTLIYTPYGPQRDRVSFTLDSVNLDCQAATRKEPLGVITPIHLCEEVIESAHKLRQIRIESDRQCFGIVECKAEGEDNMSPLRQQSEGAGNEESHRDTQLAYGTQVVHRIRTPSKSTEKETELRRRITNEDAKRHNLLSLLHKGSKPPAHQESVPMNEQRPMGLEGEPQAMREDQPNAGPSNGSNIFPNTAAHTVAPKAPSAGGFTRTSTGRASNERAALPPADRMQSTRLPPSYPRGDAIEKLSASATRNGNSLSIIGQGETSPEGPKTIKSGQPSRTHTDKGFLSDLEPEWLRNTCLADGCGRVPGAQQKLLSSWQKHRTGTNDRFPDANIPIDVLKALKQFELNATSSDPDSSDEVDSSASNAHSPEKENSTIDDEEDSTASRANLPAEEHENLSDEEDDSPVSWSSTPAAESPKAPFRRGPALPPDSSLPDKSTASQSELREESFVQEAQRVVFLQSSNEEPMDHHLSPPLVPDRDDSDMDMELDVPRGLEDRIPTRNVAPGATAIQQAAIVQVKETPYPKHRGQAPSGNAIVVAHAQQQNSSGTSKATSSTSIIYGTYHDPSSSAKSVARDTEVGPSNFAVPVSSNDGPKDIVEPENNIPLYSADYTPAPNAEPVDVLMKGARDEPQPSPHLEDERQRTHTLTSPLKPLDDSNPRPELERTAANDQLSLLVSPGQTPVSGQRSHSGEDPVVGPSYAKRKFNQSPSTQGRRPSKRGKIPKYMGFGTKPTTDFNEVLRGVKKAHYEDFIQRERTVSLASSISGSDAKPGAQSTLSPSSQKADNRFDEPLANLQERSIIDMKPSKRESPAATTVSLPKPKKRNFSSVDEFDKALSITMEGHERSNVEPSDDEPSSPATKRPRSKQSVLESDTKDTDQNPFLGPPPALELPVDVDMKIDADLENGSIESTLDRNAGVDRIVADHAISDYDCSRRSQAPSSRLSDMPSKVAPLATTSKEGNTSMPSSTQSTTIFETFKATYPAYTGDTRHFLGQCKQMEKLDEQDKMVPKWQWDDFIIRNRTDYRDYANQCLDNGEDAEPYYRFYKDNIRDTLYTEGVVESRKTLAAAIHELEGGPAANATVTTAKGTGARMPEAPAAFTSASSTAKTSVARGSSVKASTAETPISKAPARNQATVKAPSPLPIAQGKPRQSLPSAFNKSSGAKTGTAPKPNKERPRQSLPASSRRALPSLPSSSSIHESTPAKQPSGLSTSTNMSTRRSRLQRMSSGSRNPTEPTGDPYRDFVFGLNRATSFTGSTNVDPDPRNKWPGNLHVRPAAEVKKKGYDVLAWKDDL
ncbi:uncharacterized protein N0V89_003032 [Didymosphaeria variabile]|uniref:Telomere replication protein EST3 n=1 Tax=Didymosphaeria variabile TaxID=1932322 RepID=A0A9W9CF41_9PLEO|nr:uncharacterized protein N0V89_003032 [Didymosphaeria variabile]KAJ4358449.1 hypothetical protein N0V89_003032 [Didymosphaeria variabile]